MLDKFLSEEALEEPKHKYHFRGDSDYSIMAAVFWRWIAVTTVRRGRLAQRLIAFVRWRTTIVL